MHRIHAIALAAVRLQRLHAQRRRYLCSVRISDYARHEGEIDWEKAPVPKEEAYSINLADEFVGAAG